VIERSADDVAEFSAVCGDSKHLTGRTINQEMKDGVVACRDGGRRLA